LGNPVPNANVKIEDNLNGSYNETFTTNINGIIRWIPVTEYIEQDTDGDTVGEKTYFTPHRIIAWNNSLVGYADPDPLMEQSKTVNIVLYNGTLLDLNQDWNLISLPRPQSDTNLQTVLQSIESRYDSGQGYNTSDNSDPWKDYHVSKPSQMNDLRDLNNDMGFWLRITDPEGTSLVVFGNEPTSNQTIQLYKGWNLVGYPSLTNYNRTSGLTTLIMVQVSTAFNGSTPQQKPGISWVRTIPSKSEEVTGFMPNQIVFGRCPYEEENIFNIPLCLGIPCSSSHFGFWIRKHCNG
jgi:hypothetical protein